MALYQNSGQSPERRREEAQELIERLTPVIEQMTIREDEFLSGIENSKTISPKQLFWLRDLCEKYSV